MEQGNLVDLHVHSSASDGTLAPAEVVRLAFDVGLRAIALTDHDTVSGIGEALAEAERIREEYGKRENKETVFEVIPGIEISCNYEGKELHILGFYVDVENEAFLEGLEEIRQKRIRRNEQMAALCIEYGMDISMEELYHGNPGTVVTRAHFARVMQEKGYVKTKAEAFKKYISPGCPLYLPKPDIAPEHAMELLHMASAVPVLAHPLQYRMGDAQLERCIVFLKELGLKGIEAYHSSNNTYESGKLKNMAIRQGLLVTGGSDFHGDNKPDIRIGKGRGGLRVHESMLEAVRKQHAQLCSESPI